MNFLSELCKASQLQLSSCGRRHDMHASAPTNALLLYRLGDVLLGCMRGDRPLLHVMKCWAAVSPHLIEVSHVMKCWAAAVSPYLIEVSHVTHDEMLGCCVTTSHRGQSHDS